MPRTNWVFDPPVLDATIHWRFLDAAGQEVARGHGRTAEQAWERAKQRGLAAEDQSRDGLTAVREDPEPRLRR